MEKEVVEYRLNLNRRRFLSTLGVGFGSVALGSLLMPDGRRPYIHIPPIQAPPHVQHRPPRLPPRRAPPPLARRGPAGRQRRGDVHPDDRGRPDGVPRAAPRAAGARPGQDAGGDGA